MPYLLSRRTGIDRLAYVAVDAPFQARRDRNADLHQLSRLGIERPCIRHRVAKLAVSLAYRGISLDEIRESFRQLGHGSSKHTRAVDIEAVLLTGGASRRMGADKASLLIQGVPQAERIALGLQRAGLPVTVLGRMPIERCSFVLDAEEFAGPLSALARFEPSADFVFVCSCDLPRFDSLLVQFLRQRIGAHEAAVPVVNGWRQPLCALYRGSAFEKLGPILDSGHGCAMSWLDSLDHVVLAEEAMRESGIDPLCAQGANTREEWDELLGPESGSFNRAR